MFKIEVTHDIDHLGIKDHYFDLVVPKFLVLTWIAVLKGNIRLTEGFFIHWEIAKSLCLPGYDAWYCLDDWIELEDRHQLQSTWFVACGKGKGIAYSIKKARRAVELLRRHGRAIGLHSQMRGQAARLAQELAVFREAYAVTGPVPLRMHYLAVEPASLESCADLFLYDSSIYDEQRFSHDNDWQRPINIMDAFFLSPLKQNLSLGQAQSRTREIFAAAKERQQTVVIDLHQRSLSRTLPRYRQYIHWLCGEITRWQP